MPRTTKKKVAPKPKSAKTVRRRRRSVGAKIEELNGLMIEKLPGYFLIVLLIAAFGFLFYLLWPFAAAIFIGAILSIVFYPVHRRLKKALGNWDRTAAFISCLLVILILVIPVTVFIIMLAGEAQDTYVVIQDKIESGVFDKYLDSANDTLLNVRERVSSFVDLDGLDIKGTLLDLGQKLTNFLVSQAGSLVEGFLTFLFDLLMMFFAMFYFFKDGDHIVKRIEDASPLPSVYEKEIFDRVRVMSRAIIFGVFFAAVVQGVIGGIGFAFAGISNAIFWGAAMGFFSIVPVVGTAIVWAPAVVILLVLGQVYAAIFILVWGAFVVGTSDNILRTYFIGSKAQTYPLITFFVILGGILVMGLKGVIVGPLALMVLVSLLHIYEVEYSKLLQK